MNAGLIVVKVFTIITTVMMRFSLVPDFVRMRKQRGTGDMSVMPPVMLFTNCFTLSFYSYVINDIVPLFVTHKKESASVIVVAVFVCLATTIYAVLATAGVTRQSHSSISTTLGFITIGTTIVLYGSPMAMIISVLQTKTASSMPFTMGVVNVLNSLGWILYSSSVGNMFILAPNIGGIILGTTQMVLTYIYSDKPDTDEQILSTSLGDADDPKEISVVLQSRDQEDDEKRSFSPEYSGSSDFVALCSPNCEDAKTILRDGC